MDKGKDKDVGNMSTNDIINEANKTQKKSLAHLNTTIIEIEQMKAIGSSTLQQMADNTTKIERTTDNANKIQDDLKLSSRHFSSFVRKYATDKLCMFLACLLISFIVVICVLTIINTAK